MNLSKYSKTFDIRKQIQSRSDIKRLQLPNINKTIDLVTRYEKPEEKNKTFTKQFEWITVDKNYHEMNDQELYRQYQALRKEIFQLNDLVVKELQKFQRKVSRKRIITQVEPQKVNEIREKQIENNMFILDRMKHQYTGLKVKSQTLQPKEEIQSEIERTKSDINKIKQKITSLKLKNKEIGDSIMNTDQVIAELKQSQRSFDVWIKKKRHLQARLDKVNTQTDKININLQKITIKANSAEQFFKSKQNQKKHQIQQSNHLEAFNQKLHSFRVLKKNHQIFSGLKQQKYHQLLKMLEAHVERDEKMNERMQEIEYGLVDFGDQVNILQRKLKELKHQNSTMGFYESSVLDNSPEMSIDSDQSLNTQKVKTNPRLSLFIQKRQNNISSKKTSAKTFSKKDVSTSANEITSKKIFKPKFNSDKTTQFKLNISQNIVLKDENTINEKSIVKENSLVNKRINFKSVEDSHQQRNQIPKSPNKPQRIKEKQRESFKSFDQTPNNQNKTQRQLKKYKIGEVQKKVSQKLTLQKLPNIPQDHHKKLEQDQSFQMLQQIQNVASIIIQASQKKQDDIQKQINEILDNKLEKQKRIQQRLEIDLGRIEENIQKVSRSRIRAKQEITQNFTKFMNLQRSQHPLNNVNEPQN